MRPWTLALLLVLSCAGQHAAVSRDSVMSPDALLETVRILCSRDFEGRKLGTPGGRKTQAFLVDAFRSAGLEPLPGIGFRQDIGGGANVVGMVRGSGPRAGEHVVVGAHFDHLGVKDGELFPGANDNASGVAVLLALARTMAASPPERGRSVLFVAFDAEEDGLLGSKRFAANPPVERSTIAAAVILDMLGARVHDAFGDELFVLGTEKSADLEDVVRDRKDVAGLRVSRLGLHVMERLPVGQKVWSDYGPFRDLGIPLAFLSTGMTPTYHQPADRPETLSPSLFGGAALWVERFVRGVVELPARPQYDHAREDIGEDLKQVSRMVELALDPARNFRSPLVRPAKLQAHLARLDQLRKRVTRGEELSEQELSELRAAALRVSCYAGGPDSPFSSLCNAF